MKTDPLLSFVKSNWPALVMLALATVAMLWFTVVVLLDVVFFNDPRHHDEALKPWMTPRYVVMSYDLPRDVVAEVLELPATGPSRLKLGTIAAQMGLTMEELTVLVQEAAMRHREARQ